MGKIRFRKTINLGNDIRMNISSGSGVSYSFGSRGNTTTIAKDGIYKNVSIPGTGISCRSKISDNKTKKVKEVILDTKGGKEVKKYRIYTDGGCVNTQSKAVGSWAYIILKTEKVESKDLKDYSEVEKKSGMVLETTNNKMEMEATFNGIKKLEELGIDKEKDEVEILSDSMYVIKGSSEWVDKWADNNWKTLTGKDVKNQDLWMKMLKIKKKFKNLTFTWVKGHNTDQYNIECDAMCQKEIKAGVDKVQKETLES